MSDIPDLSDPNTSPDVFLQAVLLAALKTCSVVPFTLKSPQHITQLFHIPLNMSPDHPTHQNMQRQLVADEAPEGQLQLLHLGENFVKAIASSWGAPHPPPHNADFIINHCHATCSITYGIQQVLCHEDLGLFNCVIGKLRAFKALHLLLRQGWTTADQLFGSGYEEDMYCGVIIPGHTLQLLDPGKQSVYHHVKSEDADRRTIVLRWRLDKSLRMPDGELLGDHLSRFTSVRGTVI